MSKTEIAYISGPISGLENGNFDAFMKAQKFLESKKYIVVNPHEVCKDIYDKWAKMKEPDNETELQKFNKRRWNEFMKRCLIHLLGCDCVFVLRNWESSPGAIVEIFVAQKLDIPVYMFDTMSEFEISLNVNRVSKNIPI